MGTMGEKSECMKTKREKKKKERKEKQGEVKINRLINSLINKRTDVKNEK